MHRWTTFEEGYAELAGLDPADRIPLLVDEFDGAAFSIPTDDVRRLFLFAWGDGGPVSTDRDRDVLTMLRWIAPVRDGGNYLVGTLTVYRSAGGEGHESIRWTLDENLAAAQGSGGVLRATVPSNDVLAHLVAGGEDQVLVDPEDLENLERIQPGG
jgi:hypothetical protein